MLLIFNDLSELCALLQNYLQLFTLNRCNIKLINLYLYKFLSIAG